MKARLSTYRQRLFVAAVCCGATFLLAAGAASTEHKKARSVVPRALPDAISNFGRQTLGIDAKGRAAVLRKETLEVFRLEATGELEPLEVLKFPPGFSEVIRAAVMAPDGDEWYLLGAQDVWRATAQTVEKLPPVGWRVDNLTRAGDEPVVSVMPFGVGKPVRKRVVKTGERAPQLLNFSASDWTVLLEEGTIPGGEEVVANYARINQERMLEFAPSRSNRLWAADCYRYRVRQVSPAGKVLATLAGSLEIRLDDKDADSKTEAMANGAGPALSPGREILANLAIPVIRGLGEGPDGRLYLVTNLDFLALDRFDPVTLKLERVPLELPFNGRLMVGGATDGLYLLGYSSETGRWFVPWGKLEEADWQPVEDVEING